MLTTNRPLRTDRGCLLQEQVRLRQRRRRSEPLEDLAGLLEHGRSLGRSAESNQGAALAEERDTSSRIEPQGA
jgi:hypothetical protein